MVGVPVVWCYSARCPVRVGRGETQPEPGCLSVSHTPCVRRGNKTQDEKLTALEAHRAGKLYLPPGYELEHGADVLLLRRRDGSMAAAFGATGATPSEVARTAEEDYRRHGKSSA